MPVAGLERFKPNVAPPPEFRAFWRQTVAALGSVAPSPVVREDESGHAGLRLDCVTYTSLGGAAIQGYLLRPTPGQPRPVVVHAHGYEDRYEVMIDWARHGLNVFGFDARGFGRSEASVETAKEGYVLTGIASPEESILRGAVADYVQAIRVARELLSGELTTITCYGFSFGGALALMASALSDDPDFVVVGQPTFGWNDERRRLSLAGSAQHVKDYVERFPWRLDNVTSTLSYFDTLHFASLVSAPTLVGIGLDDDVVPSRTVLAMVNHMRCPVEVRILPVSHSADPRESLWQGFHDEWLDISIHGVPPGFGAGPRQVRAAGRAGG